MNRATVQFHSGSLRTATCLTCSFGALLLVTQCAFSAVPALSCDFDVYVYNLKGRPLPTPNVDSDDVIVRAYLAKSPAGDMMDRLARNSISGLKDKIEEVNVIPNGAIAPQKGIRTLGGACKFQVVIAGLIPEDAFLVLTFTRTSPKANVTAISPFLAIPRKNDGTLAIVPRTVLHITVPKFEPPACQAAPSCCSCPPRCCGRRGRCRGR